MKKSKLSFLTLINSDTKESITLSPTLGGTIVSLVLGKNLFQIMANDLEKDLLQNPLFRGRILFPFNDRIPGGKYQFLGKKYQLPINCSEDGSAIHGFMYNRKVSIEKQTETDVEFYWRTGKNKIGGYPFDVSLTTKIELYSGGLKLSFNVKNHSDTSAPFALGWHSYFKTDSSSKLKAEYPSYFNIDGNFLPVGNCIPVDGTNMDFTTGTIFSNKQLDHTFAVPSDNISILKNKDYSIQIKQTNFEYTQLFLPPDKESIAIEPISSKPNSFNSQNVLVLKTGEEYHAGIDIDIIY